VNTVGWKLKIVKAWQRLVASYLRGLGVAVTALSITNATSDGFNPSIAKTLGIALVSGLVGPVAVFLTEAGDAIGDEADVAQKP